MAVETFRDVRPSLLSYVLDEYFVGTKEEVDLRRKCIVLKDSIASTDGNEKFTGGSYGDGFKKLCSDVDEMIIQDVVVMFQETYQHITTTNKTILLIRKALCRPGYVNLEIGHMGEWESQAFLNSIVPFLKSLYLSSDIYREEVLKHLNTLGHQGASCGPSNKLRTPFKETADFVYSFPCFSWPPDALEWISRTRVFGWPSKDMINKIVGNGCHVVPVGDKCSDNTILQWRLSFVTAERYLVYSLNHVQFKVYGLLKYLLNQIKYRMKQDIGDDDILCSYFMKTLVFFAIENSPQSLWQEKNIFVCFWFCFTMFLDWVDAEYCPNYFIKSNNMFQRKVHGESKLKLLNILCELHQMKWTCLSVGTVYKFSVWHLLHSSSAYEQLMQSQMTPEQEGRKDFHLINLRGRLILETANAAYMRNSLIMLYNARTDTDEFLTYFMTVRILCILSMMSYKGHSGGNKDMYRSLKRCKHCLTPSFGSERLYLATFYYLTGNYGKTLELCRNFILSVKLFKNNEELQRYLDTYFGRESSTFHKIKNVFMYYIVFTNQVRGFCLPHLYLELERHHPFHMYTPPHPYALFLIFLCHFAVGDSRGCDLALQELEAVRYESSIEGESWIVHTLLGICYQTKGDYYSAIMAYQDSLKLQTEFNPALDRIEYLSNLQ